MAKKKHAEDHVNHELWVVSYADMVTLLFALFVVLYALGQVDLAKLRKVKQSLAFAFHFEGSGKTKDLGIHDRGDIGGAVIEGAPLLTAQKGPMREFLHEQLPKEFEEATGQSLEIVQTDDTIAFRAPLSAFFQPGNRRLRPRIDPWLKKLVQASNQFTSKIHIRIRAPKRRLGRDDHGVIVYTKDLCLQRLSYLQLLVGYMPGIVDEQIKLEFRYMAPTVPSRANWEDQAEVAFAFSNAQEKF